MYIFGNKMGKIIKGHSQIRPFTMGDNSGELKNSLCCCLSQTSGVCRPLTFFIGLEEKWLCKYTFMHVNENIQHISIEICRYIVRAKYFEEQVNE